MSWSIAEVVNNVKVSKSCADEIYALNKKNEDSIWYDRKEVTYEGRLTFNPDHSEHMDYIGNSEGYATVLKKHKVKGDICFGSLEGDNAGSFWGYRFDGKGGMAGLEGKLVWKEEK